MGAAGGRLTSRRLITGSSVGPVRIVVGALAAVAAVLALAVPSAAQILPPQTDASDAEAYQECRATVVEGGGDELDAARECVPELRDFVLCVGSGRVTRAEVVRCVEVQVEDAYADTPAATTTTSAPAATTTTAASSATTEPGAAAEALVEEMDGGDGGDSGFGLPVLIGVGLAGLVLGGLLGAARGRRSEATVEVPVTAGSLSTPPVPVPVAAPVSDVSSERDELVQALIDAADQVSSDAVRTSIVHRLAAVGVEPIVVGAGERFDPSVHRGVDAASAPSVEQNDTVAALERPGWTDRGQVLRPPEVVVNRWEGDAT